MKRPKNSRTLRTKRNTNPAGKAGFPVSLYPLSFEEAVSGLARVKMPETDKKRPKANSKKN